MHPRQKIRESVHTALTQEIAGYSIFLERSIPRTTTSLPSIAIFSRSDELVSELDLKQTLSVRSVSVSVVVKRKIEQEAKEIDEVLKVENTLWDIEKVLRTSDFIDENIVSLEFQSMQISTEAENSPSIVEGVLTYNFNIAPFY